MSKKDSNVSRESKDLQSVVDAERKALDVAFKEVSRSKTTARDFLVSAGILTKKGNLAKAYR
jgi:hypothetical protein